MGSTFLGYGSGKLGCLNIHDLLYLYLKLKRGSWRGDINSSVTTLRAATPDWFFGASAVSEDEATP